MSKRTRGTPRPHRRPGARPPTSRPAGARPARPTTTAATDQLTGAIELSEAIEAPVVEDRVAPVAAARRTAHTAHIRPRAKPGSVLAARAANEYVYVAHDIRRIVVVAALLFGAMIAAWLLLVVLKVIPLGLY